MIEAENVAADERCASSCGRPRPRTPSSSSSRQPPTLVHKLRCENGLRLRGLPLSAFRLEGLVEPAAPHFLPLDFRETPKLFSGPRQILQGGSLMEKKSDV